MFPPKTYESREDAGRILANEIEKLQLKNPVLVAIPRGGIQVAECIADRLKIPNYPIIVKKLPLPQNPETAFGAITENNDKILDEDLVEQLGLSEDQINTIANNVIKDIKHRACIYGNLKPEVVRSRDVIIADDGLATGFSLIAAIKSIKKMNPASITVAVPVSSETAYRRIMVYVDNLISPIVESTFYFAVSSYYKLWYDMPEDDIVFILDNYRNKYSKKAA